MPYFYKKRTIQQIILIIIIGLCAFLKDDLYQTTKMLMAAIHSFHSTNSYFPFEKMVSYVVGQKSIDQMVEKIENLFFFLPGLFLHVKPNMFIFNSIFA